MSARRNQVVQDLAILLHVNPSELTVDDLDQFVRAGNSAYHLLLALVDYADACESFDASKPSSDSSTKRYWGARRELEKCVDDTDRWLSVVPERGAA